MSLHIQNPGGGPDLSRANKRGILYIFSADSTGVVEGDIRFILEPPSTVARIEQRDSDGVWNKTSLEFDFGSIFLGDDLKVGAGAGKIETISISAPSGYQRAIVPSTEFDETGTRFPTTPALSKLEPENISGPAVSQRSGIAVGQVLNLVSAVMVDSAIFQVGSIAPTQPVNLKFYVGSDNTGPDFYDRNFGASQFTAGQPFSVDFSDSFGFDGVGTYFLEFTSNSNMSFKTDSSDVLVATFNRHLLKEKTLVTEDDLVYDDGLGHVLDDALNFVYADTSF